MTTMLTSSTNSTAQAQIWREFDLALARRARSTPRDANLPLLAWARRYLPRHFRQPPSSMHHWLGEQLDRLRSARGVKLNVIGPRGAAKSTVATLAFVLRTALEGREPYLWIVSDTADQAQMHLENVRQELETNSRLRDDYPRECAAGRRWQAKSIELAGGTRIDAYGTGQRIRGRRRDADRPSLIVCDDLQNDQHISSALQRELSASWFHGTLLNAGDKRTNFVNLATALHRDALALQLHGNPGWRSQRFRAIVRWPDRMDLWQQWERIYTSTGDTQAGDAARQFYRAHRAQMEQGVQLLWPEEEDLYTLMCLRVERGHAAFEREKQGSPTDPATCEWPEHYFEDIWFDAWPDGLTTRTMALDPSKGRDARRGDYSAVVMLAIDAHGVLYIDANLMRSPTPQLVAAAVEQCRQFRPDALGVEANQFQELLADELAEALARSRIHLVPCAIHNHTTKLLRIRRLGPLLAQRRLRFLASSPGARLLVDQLRDFPNGAHDDGPDALEMAVRLAAEVLHGRNTSDGLGSRLKVDD